MPSSFAAVEPDGTLVPFAVFDGRRWIDPMPKTPGSFTGTPETPRTFWNRQGIQVPCNWRIAPVNGLDVRNIAVTGVTGAASDIVDCYQVMDDGGGEPPRL